MRYHVLHTTDYRYAAPVQTARHIVHLAPRPCVWQKLVTQRLEVDPATAARHDAVDAFGNHVTRLELAAPHERFSVLSEMSIELAPRPWEGRLAESPTWDAVCARLDYAAQALCADEIDAQRMRFQSPGVRVKRELEVYAQPSFPSGRTLVEAAGDLMQRIHREFRYDPDVTEVGTSVLEVLANKHGVCQDFAHLMIGCLRSLGLAARYVSGYLRTDPPAGQPRMVGADASHAWVAVYIPELGWVEFDPTNNCLADERHLILAWGRDFGDVSPVRGVIQGGGEHTLKVGVTVTPEVAEAV